MTKASLLSRAAGRASLALILAVAVLLPAQPAFAAGGESTPLDLSGGGGQHATHIGGGGSIVRTIVGLAIVIGVIYGVAWILKQVKASREQKATGTGLASLASVPLGSGRAVHLVRAGRDFVLVGVGEHGVTPLRTYSELEARAAGLIDEDGMLILPSADDDRSAGRAGGGRLPVRLPLPRPRLALPAPRPSAPRRSTAQPANVLDTLRSWTVRG